MSASPIPATGTGWNTAIPDANQPHGNDYNEHHETKLAIQIRNNKEHTAYGVGSAGGEHIQGSAVDYYGDYSASVKGDSLPTLRPDGAALNSSDYGRKAWDTDSVYGGVEYVYTATGWVECSVAIKQDQTITGVKTFSSLPLIPAASGIVRKEDPIATTWSSDGKTMTGTGSKWATAGETLVSAGDYVRVISGTNATPGDYLVLSAPQDVTIHLSSAVGANPSLVNYTLIKSNITTSSPAASQNYVDVAVAEQMSPANYTGGQSVTWPNGMIEKDGLSGTITHSSYLDVVFDVPFPNGVVCAHATINHATATSGCMSIYIDGLTKTGFTLVLDNSGNSVDATAYWYAKGY